MTLTWQAVADWFVHPTVFSVGISLIVFGFTLGTLERLFHAGGRERNGSRSRLLDLIFWFFTPLVTNFVTTSLLLYILGRLVGLWGESLRPEPDHVPLVGRQPLWLQVLEVLLLGDFMHYWTHRLFHGSWFWPAHAVHHSPTELDWFSSMRMHPINDLTTHAIQSVPLYLLGFSIEAVALGVPIVMFIVVASHTNVPWTYGPLRYVVVSPVYHQWHHSSEQDALDKNFAGIFPVWDLLFGTWYMPPGKLAKRFGCKRDQPPEHLPGQLSHPLRVWLAPTMNRLLRRHSHSHSTAPEETSKC